MSTNGCEQIHEIKINKRKKHSERRQKWRKWWKVFWKVNDKTFYRTHQEDEINVVQTTRVKIRVETETKHTKSRDISRFHKLPVTWLNFSVHCTLRTRCAIRLDSVRSESVVSSRTCRLPMGHFSVFRIFSPTYLEDPRTETTANWGKVVMERSKWASVGEMDGLAERMASDQKTTTMAACVFLYPAHLVLEPNLHSRRLKRRGKDPLIPW